MKKINLVCANCGSSVFKAEMLSEVGVTGIAVESKAQSVASVSSPTGGAVAVGVAIGKVGRGSSSMDKIEAMRKAGLDVGSFFSMKGADGADMLVKKSEGQFIIVNDDDPILRGIFDDGTIPNNDLYRRWVAGQMAHALTYPGYRWSNTPAGFTGWLKSKGYDYQFKMLINEYYAQHKILHGKTPDEENYRMRSALITPYVAVKTMEHDIEVTRNWVKHLKTKNCRGRKYVTVPKYGHIYCNELETRLFGKLQSIVNELRSLLESGNEEPGNVCNLLKEYNNFRVISRSKKWSADFIDAYKKSGAYYTMKNFILFHGCEFEGSQGTEAVNRLDEYALGKYDGWVLLGMLKKMLKENNIDLKAKIAEWAKAKAERLASK